MSPNLLLMCKLLFLLLALHSFHKKLGDPFLPFIPGLDAFNLHPGLFAGALEIGFFGGGLCLLFNVRVRIAAVALGLTILLALVASKPGYRNHILISGCLFLLAGLHRRGEEPWMLSLQMAVIYFGAFLNKFLSPDWWSGQFMHNWMHNDLGNRYYEFFSPWFPGHTFAAVVSWSVVGSELVLALLFLVRRWHHLAVLLTLAMHGSFFLIVGRTPFGYFLESIVIAMLAFLHWPEGRLEVRTPRRFGAPLAKLLRFANWDQQFQRGPALPEGGADWLQLAGMGRVRRDGPALRTCLSYNAAFYVALFFAFNGVAFLWSRLPRWI